MVRVFVEIKINGSDGKLYTFRKVNKFNIRSTYYELNETAEVQIPYQLFQRYNLDVRDIIRGSNKIEIIAGYYPNKHLMFKGYIDSFTIDSSCKLVCEDENYIAKRTEVADKYWEDVSLKELIEHVYKGKYVIGREGMTFDKLGEFTIENNPSVSDVLDVLRTTYKFIIYFRDGLLHIEPLKNINRTDYKLDVGINVSRNNNKLKWVNEEDNSTCICGKTSDNATKEVTRVYYAWNTKNGRMEFTDEKPTQQKTSNISLVGISVDDLKKIMKMQYDKSYYTGYTGNVKCDLRQFVRHGDTVEFFDRYSQHEASKHVVKGVNYEFDAWSGLWQEIELAQKV